MVRVSLFALCLALAACASGPRMRLVDQFIAIGLNPDRAECLAGELAEDLDRQELSDLARFLEGLNRADTPGGALDAILRIDNPGVAAAVAGAAVSCAFGR